MLSVLLGEGKGWNYGKGIHGQSCKGTLLQILYHAIVFLSHYKILNFTENGTASGAGSFLFGGRGGGSTQLLTNLFCAIDAGLPGTLWMRIVMRRLKKGMLSFLNVLLKNKVLTDLLKILQSPSLAM